MTTPKFPVNPPSFHTELKKRINQYFTTSGKPTTGNVMLYIKATLLVVILMALYTHVVFFTPAAGWAILETVLLGFAIAGIGFNVMHDGAHGSFSKYKTVNNIASATANFLGASVHMWKSKHNIIHHTYTNISGIDDDIEAGPLLRLSDEQPLLKIHRFQHWYFLGAYSLLYIWWIFFTDYKKYFLGRIGSMPLKKMTAGEHFWFWAYKVAHAFIFVAVPIYMVGFLPWLVGFLVMTMVAGIVLSMVFQLAHTVEHTHFPKAEEAGNMGDEWAIHQIKTTANFATKNKAVSWFVGGLNFQIEHHLFPKISHVHYPAISKIIKEACMERGVNYVEYRRVRQAIASHVNYLQHLSRA